MQLGIGTPNYDGNTTLCMATAVSGLQALVRQRRASRRLRRSRARRRDLLLIGANIAENHPILCWRLRSNPDTTLIVVDPRVTKTAMMADLHLPLKPRSDLRSSTA